MLGLTFLLFEGELGGEHLWPFLCVFLAYRRIFADVIVYIFAH